jgi:glutaredoxin
MRTSLRGLLGLVVLAAGLLGLSQLAGLWHARALGQRVAQAAPGDIVMYTTTDCPYCAQARRWFGEHGVVYSECNTSVDAGCRAAFDRLAAPGVPTLVVKGQRQVGFQPERVAQALQR